MTGRVLALSLALLALAACNGNERGREVHMKKGVYLGKADQALSRAALVDLAARAELQRFGVGLDQPLAPASLPAAKTGLVLDGREAAQKF